MAVTINTNPIISHNVGASAGSSIQDNCKNTVKKHTGLKAGLLIATLSALAINGIYQATQSHGNNKNKSVKQHAVKGYCCKAIPPEQQGYMGQDKYDPRDPYNNTDPDSPFYQQTGAYGQNIYDKNNPYNKEDPASPYYDPSYSHV